jgi:hypothetical protein
MTKRVNCLFFIGILWCHYAKQRHKKSRHS